jgi:hypothetical protein
MWNDAVGSTGVHEETPVGDLVLHVDQLPGGDGNEPPHQMQGARYVLALAP